MEWMVNCGSGGLVVTEEVRVIINVTYLTVSPKANNPCDVFEPLLSGKFRLAERSRVIRVAIILVQVFREKGWVPLLESLVPFEHDFDLRGIRIFQVGHLDETIEGGLP